MSTELRQEAFHLMRKVFQQHTSRWQQCIPELTKPQYAVLRSVAENPGIEQVLLTDVAVSSKATLAEMLARLETRGLLVREADPADKRRRFITLTAEGKTVLAKTQPVGQQVDTEFLARLSPDDQQHLVRLLKSMTEDSV
ncbi:MarR family winged helix-turn-helix transcriptional regulator [Rahnella aceris]|uniref:MarR family winged helix-turn-helix transcriptional regulator n=1 Tax=Rahnella sp. (strain Y9602) TaxID=2703885 RepID=UPI000256B663|nr:MarR family transcriptional regulator [Rahnella aceris]AFE60892.1 transcriptional regulator hosA [Rahnella aquatilis HX2]MBU9842655.1 MarR family transcriptional regulator [Rahnella aceris]MBU9863622.1 MarR family transcriptional regulator [Rahnella aceris]